MKFQHSTPCSIYIFDVPLVWMVKLYEEFSEGLPKIKLFNMIMCHIRERLLDTEFGINKFFKIFFRAPGRRSARSHLKIKISNTLMLYITDSVLHADFGLQVYFFKIFFFGPQVGSQSQEPAVY